MSSSAEVEVPDHPQDILRMMHTEPARRHPHLFYDRLRELAPVCRDEDSGLWFLSRWEDCNRVLRSDRFGQGGRLKEDPRYETSSSLKLLGENLTGMDPPEHTRLRILALKGLSRAVVEGMRSYLNDLTSEVLQQLESQDEFDLVTDYAGRIPVAVICEMLGVPRTDHAKFEGWIADQFRILSPFPVSDEVLASTDRSLDALEDYLNGIIAERRRSPRNDLISAFVAAEDGEIAPMTAREAVVMTAVLLAGGSDTTRSVITLGSMALLQDEEALAKVRAEPVIPSRALEELFRFTGPVLIANPRRSLDDVTLGGAQIVAGDLVAPVLISANFDPDVFANPHQLAVQRNPNPHLAFGHGAHVCVGNMLARVVAGHAIGAVLQRFPDLQLLDETFEPRLDLFALRGVKAVRVRRR